MPVTKKDSEKFEIPEDLISAIEMSSFERQLPRQGSSAIHKFLMNPEDEVAMSNAKEWIETQKAIWPKVDEVVRRLHKVSPLSGQSFPEWHHQPWWTQLCMAWSDDLAAAVDAADKWCDRKENDESS